MIFLRSLTGCIPPTLHVIRLRKRRFVLIHATGYQHQFLGILLKIEHVSVGKSQHDIVFQIGIVAFREFICVIIIINYTPYYPKLSAAETYEVSSFNDTVVRISQ